MKNITQYSTFLFVAAAFALQACSVPQTTLESETMSSQNQSLLTSAQGVTQQSLFETLVNWRTTGNPDTNSLVKDLESLQISGPTASVRYQAFLSSYILKDEVALYLLFDPSSYKTSTDYFKDLGAYVNEELVTAFVEASL